MENRVTPEDDLERFLPPVAPLDMPLQVIERPKTADDDAWTGLVVPDGRPVPSK